jgi:hypothetical protein
MSFKLFSRDSESNRISSIKSKRSQSALEYMMTYGWAILIIVIVAVILYSMGIFNPSSSVSSTVTGFSGLGSVTAECTANGVLRISVGDSTGNLINVTGITAKDPSITKTANFKPNSTVDPNPLIRSGTFYLFSVPNICPSAGTHYAITVAVNYTEPGQVLPGPYQSLGSITGTVTSTSLPAFAAFFNGNAYLNLVSGGANTYINATDPLPGTNQSYTLVLWALDTDISNSPYGNDSNGLFAFSPGALSYQDLGIGPNVPGRQGPGLHRCKASDTFVNVPTDFFNSQWHFVAVSVNKPSYLFELDSNQYTASNSNGFSSGSLIAIGPYQFNYCDEGPFNGYITNVQLYNGALSASQLLALYNEGISGAPLSVSGISLVGWWPLNETVNGLVKDYAGSDNGNFIHSYVSSNFP